MKEQRLRACEMLEGEKTSKGKDRADAIRGCGRLRMTCDSQMRVGVMAEQCRDRACPRCAALRSAKLGAELRSASECRIGRSMRCKSCRELHPRDQPHRDDCPACVAIDKHVRKVSVSGRRHWFVTLTQLKKTWQSENASQALDRVLWSWRRLMGSSYRSRNRDLRDMVTGGIRALEITWSGRGSKLCGCESACGCSYKVKYSGYHAHLHCIMETPDWVELEDLETVLRIIWEWASPGCDPDKGVNVQYLHTTNVGQCAKYVSKPYSAPPRRAREMFNALEGRRMFQGFGEWLSWRKWVFSEGEPVSVSVDTLKSLAWRWSKYSQGGRGSTRAESLEIPFERWAYDPELGCMVRVADYRSTPERLRVELGAQAERLNEEVRAKRLARHERRARRRSR